METLNVTTTRNSPKSLSDIGFKDNDLVTINALADEIGRAYEMIPVSWITKYANDNSPAIKGVLEYMLDEWRKEKK